MPTFTIQAGVPVVVTQTTTFALPPQAVWLHAGAAVEVSLDGTNWAVLANSTVGAQTSAPFVRCTTGTTTISVKRMF